MRAQSSRTQSIALLLAAPVIAYAGSHLLASVSLLAAFLNLCSNDSSDRRLREDWRLQAPVHCTPHRRIFTARPLLSVARGTSCARTRRSVITDLLNERLGGGHQELTALVCAQIRFRPCDWCKASTTDDCTSPARSTGRFVCSCCTSAAIGVLGRQRWLDLLQCVFSATVAVGCAVRWLQPQIDQPADAAFSLHAQIQHTFSVFSEDGPKLYVQLLLVQLCIYYCRDSVGRQHSVSSLLQLAGCFTARHAYQCAVKWVRADISEEALFLGSFTAPVVFAQAGLGGGTLGVCSSLLLAQPWRATYGSEGQPMAVCFFVSLACAVLGGFTGLWWTATCGGVVQSIFTCLGVCLGGCYYLRVLVTFDQHNTSVKYARSEIC